ncbi:MAG: transporter substrate-binding domain-containing protein [Pseudomonas marincola]
MSLINFGSAQSSAEPKKLTFSQINENQLQKSAADFLTVMYKRLGFEATFVQAPGRRALELSNSGKTDGEVYRIHSVNKIYKNLVRIPTPIISITNYAFTLDERHIVNSADDLKPMLRVGIVRGFIWAETLVKDREWVVYADSTADLADKLLKGSVDVILASGKSIQDEFSKLNSSRKVYKGDPISLMYVYHYLHKSRQDLVSDVDAEILKMIESNEIEKIIGRPYIAQK